MSTRPCPSCRCSVPTNSWHQHTSGKRHQSFRFCGEANTVVTDILIRHHFTGQVERRLRRHEVENRTVEISRRARDLILPTELVKHSGVSLHDAACRSFGPEKLCAALIQLEDVGNFDRSSGNLYPPARSAHLYDETARMVIIDHASVQDIAVVAASLNETKSFGGEEETRRFISHLHLKVDVRMSNPGERIHPALEASFSAALSTLAAQLVHLRGIDDVGELGGASAEIDIGAVLQQRRHVAMLVDNLSKSLRTATCLRRLLLNTAPGTLRDEDMAQMTAAALANWRERELVVLLGTHARSESYFKLLPATLLWHVLGFVSEWSRTELVFEESGLPLAAVAQTLGLGAQAPVPPPPINPGGPQGGPGADLDFVAMLVE